MKSIAILFFVLLILSVASCGLDFDCEPDCGPHEWCLGNNKCECFPLYEEPDCAVAKVQRVVGNFAGARYIDGNAPIQDTLRITSDSLAQTDLFLVDDSIMISFSFTANDSLRIVDYYQQTQFDGRGTEGKGWISANNDSLYLDYTTIVTDNGIYDTTLHVFTGKRF